MDKQHLRILLIIILMCITAGSVDAATPHDTVAVAATDTLAAKPGFFRKIAGYIAGDLDAPDEKATTGLSIIGGPHYDSMTRLGVGIVGNYGYRLKDCHAPLPPSNLSVKGDISTAKFWTVEALNNMIIDGDSKRVNSLLKVEYMPLYYWGIGFGNGRNEDNKTRMKQLRFEFNTNVLFRLAKGLYVGPYVHWEFNRADSIEKPELLENQPLHQRNYGVGFTVDYDTRDYITVPTRGVYLHINQVFFPRFLWNGNFGFTRTDLRFSIYKKAWRGAVIAADVRALFNYGTPSWATMALMGDSYNMRGYYHGRYRDKHMMTAVVELRQHLWKWLGMAAWAGAGSVFHNSESIHVLPNVGIGLRWAFRKHVNVRMDFGLGRSGESAFIFGINEAF